MECCPNVQLVLASDFGVEDSAREFNMEEVVNGSGVGNLGVLKKIEKLFETFDVVAAGAKLVDVWVVELAIERHVTAIVDR